MKILKHDHDLLDAGTWSLLKRDGGKNNSAFVKCPYCGQIASLANHTIDESGIVNPSLVCPYNDCDFHDWVRLKDWG